MLIHLHTQATMAPRICAEIQASDEPGAVLAERFGVTPQTIYKWHRRDSVHDRSHTPNKLQTKLTPAQEAVAVDLRATLLISLDDLLAVVREFLNPQVSCSGLDRCLRRHGVGNLRDLPAKAARPKHSGFKAYEPGYIHIDVKHLPQMADETSRRYLFLAIDRATRWVFERVYPAKTAANARRFLRELERAAPIKITRLLTDNGKEFTDRLFGQRWRAATGNHDFARHCADLRIEPRLGPPRTTWSSASTAGSRTCCRATISPVAWTWSRPSCARPPPQHAAPASCPQGSNTRLGPQELALRAAGDLQETAA